MNMIYSAVIFDMDGLILDTEILYRKAWQKAAFDCGYTLTDEGHSMLLGRGRKGAFAKLCEFVGGEFQKDRFLDHLPIVEEEVFNTHPLIVKAGVLEALDFLDSHNVKSAVATSTVTYKAEDRLESCNLKHRFQAIIGGDKVIHTKPEPDIYLLAAKKLGVAPGACLVLEDAETGALAGLNAGMDVIMIPDLKQPSPEISSKCKKILPSLLEVPKFLTNGVGSAL